jgi:hypothetical protein
MDALGIERAILAGYTLYDQDGFQVANPLQPLCPRKSAFRSHGARFTTLA